MSKRAHQTVFLSLRDGMMYVPTYVTTKGRQQMSRVINWQRVASPPYTNIRNFTHLCTHLELILCETPVELSLPLADLDPPHLPQDSHEESAAKQHLDRFSRFGTAHLCAKHALTTLRATCVKKDRIRQLNACHAAQQ